MEGNGNRNMISAAVRTCLLTHGDVDAGQEPIVQISCDLDWSSCSLECHGFRRGAAPAAAAAAGRDDNPASMQVGHNVASPEQACNDLGDGGRAKEYEWMQCVYHSSILDRLHSLRSRPLVVAGDVVQADAARNRAPAADLIRLHRPGLPEARGSWEQVVEVRNC